ncbi:hypothetical protein VIN01S_06120 [Vibrio inusitatus NBRC 102082]|uniref:VWFA domain-containing protein n=1 Tax=Vibrio inusitatus NBRC 102082 TaxID=1219070 RepID=A0A4Y3HRY6_9VIBR|nr:vWA domain-containing protein [Vibrio inusitatus]GEA49808.1 hypothetical protein VIN01S_06120 [Vibrio inusitatus NBRC 102082]
MDMTQKFHRNTKESQGLAVLLTVIALPFLLIMAGLAIDSGRAYSMQAKLFSAVDAAAIAAARAVAQGETAAEDAAQKYFDVNLSEALKTASPILGTPVITQVDDGSGGTGYISISLSATANMPTAFIGLLGFDTWAVGAQAEAIRRPVDIVLIVDNSGSLSDEADTVIARSKSFVSNFSESFDRVSIVKYANGAEVPVPFSDSRGFTLTNGSNGVIDEIDNFDISSGQYTNTAEGFYKGYSQISNVDTPADLQVIVFFTDGTPTAMTAEVGYRTGSGSSATDELVEGVLRISGGSGAHGLWDPDKVYAQLDNSDGDYYEGGNIESKITMTSTLGNSTGLNHGNVNLFEVDEVTPVKRSLTNFDGPSDDNSSILWGNIQQASRNLPEQMASTARSNNIFVFTLGLGDALQEESGKDDDERGEYLLYRMANDPAMLTATFPGESGTPLAADFDPDQKQGVYCFAETEDDLGPCFDKMLEVIIRLTL